MSLRTFARSGLAGVVTAIVVSLGGLLFVAMGSASEERVAVFFFINLTVVVGLQIFMGNAHVTNFGHIAMMGIGAFVTAVLSIPIGIKATALPDAPFGLGDIELCHLGAAAVAVIVVVVFAAVTGLLLARIAGIAATIATLALLFTVQAVLLNWEALTRGSRVLFGVPIWTRLPWAIGIASVTIVSARLIRDSRVGVQLRAAGEDPLAAAAMGVSVRRLRYASWVVSSGYVALGGVLYAHFLGTVSPDAFYLHLTFLTVAMLLLGGLGSVTGAVVGTVVVTAGFEFMRWLEKGPSVGGRSLPEMIGLAEVFLGLVIVLTMARRPHGIVGDDELDERVERWWRARRAATDTVASSSDEVATS